jgi:dTDP-4-dehydrorhamnose 3,5-epimerase
VTVRRLESHLDGLVFLEPKAFTDERGFFLESYNRRMYGDLGIDSDFVQDNHSRSVRHTIRGLHYQVGRGQDKLVRVARGHIWDVAVDIRPASPTFGRWEAFELDDVAHRQLFVPVGFAHGFCVLSESADVCYKVSAYYDPSTERGIAWDDPTIAITWPAVEPRLSERDMRNPTLTDATDLT